MAAIAFWACFGSADSQAKLAQQLKMMLLTMCTYLIIFLLQGFEWYWPKNIVVEICGNQMNFHS
jgi:hypothetical protein